MPASLQEPFLSSKMYMQGCESIFDDSKPVCNSAGAFLTVKNGLATLRGYF